MSFSLTKTEDGKIPYKAAGGSLININISQGIYWDFWDRPNTLGKIPSEAPTTAPMPPTSYVKTTALPVVLGVSQFPLGVICVVVHAIVLAANLDEFPVFFARAPIWMGIPFILSGLSEVVAYIKNHGFLVFLSFICQLLNFCVSVAGLKLTEETRKLSAMFLVRGDPCETLLNKAQPSSYQLYGLSTSSYNLYVSSEQTYALNQCLHAIQISKNLTFGLLIVLLIIGSWGVISSTISVFYRLKRLYESCCPYKELAKEDNESPEKASLETITV